MQPDFLWYGNRPCGATGLVSWSAIGTAVATLGLIVNSNKDTDLAKAYWVWLPLDHCFLWARIPLHMVLLIAVSSIGNGNWELDMP